MNLKPEIKTVHKSQADYELYVASLNKKKISYKIVDEQKQPDNSVIVKVKKQYNDYDTGDYLG